MIINLWSLQLKILYVIVPYLKISQPYLLSSSYTTPINSL